MTRAVSSLSPITSRSNCTGTTSKSPPFGPTPSFTSSPTGPTRRRIGCASRVMTPEKFCASALCLGFLFANHSEAESQAPTNSAAKFPCDQQKIPHYTAYRANEVIRVDGKLDEKCWQAVPRSPRFAHILTGKATLYDTRSEEHTSELQSR